jgi:hypothetical protein
MGGVRPSPLVLAAVGLASGAALIAAAAEGCALPSFTLEIPPEGGADTGPPEAGPPPCNRATYPDPPGGADDGGAGPTLVFALHSIDLGDMGTTPGYDLDNVCTCFDDAGPSCVGKSAQLTTYCDLPAGPGNQGIDNQSAKLFQLIEIPVGQSVFGSSVFSLQADSGSWSMLIRVEGYNGLPDDPAVDVALFPSSGLGGNKPAWNGNDIWPVVGTSVGDAGVASPLFHSNGAYVSQGMLVATMPTTEMTIHGGGLDSITVHLTAGVLTAHLVQINGQWHLQNGTLAARWALTDVFKAIGSYRDNNGKPICTDQIASYTLAKQAICQDADILVDGTQPKSAPCDALSVGIGFTADPAVLGTVVDAGALTPGCPAATDPSNDMCN